MDTPRASRWTWRVALLVAAAVPLWGAAVVAATGFGLLRGLSLVHALTLGLAAPLLSAVGAATLLGRRPLSWALALAGTGLVVLLSFPDYAPADRGPALRTGAEALAERVGLESAGAGAAAERLASWLGSEAQPVSAVVEPAPVEPPRKIDSPPREDNVVELPYEGEGRSMRVQATFEGVRSDRELTMLFDTGASFTTLDRANLATLGVAVNDDLPTVRLNTANGTIEAPVVLVPAIWVGDQPVEWVTVAVCEDCRQGEVKGLLGLNVSGQFGVALDHDDRLITLTPREDAERHLDIEPWLGISSMANGWPDGRVEVTVVVDNKAPRSVSEAVVEVRCQGDASFAVQLDDLPARGSKESTVKLPRGTDCGSYSVGLLTARW